MLIRSISRLYYRGANACILCYSITDPASFTAMSHWLTELRAHLPPDIILHVVGTKSDIVARDPSQRAVPFERCIAYVAENLDPDGASTPPPTTPGGILEDAKQRKFLQENGPISPASKQSSGFWGMEAGWDCCHEVSASTGEGVDEVFRVVTRKLVEQHRQMSAQLASAMTPALGLMHLPAGMVPPKTPGLPGTPGYFGLVRGREKGEGEGYFDRLGGEAPGARPGGSFRVGKDRRSWLGFPTPGFDRERTMWGNNAGIETEAIDEGIERRLTGSSEGKEGSQRRGRCC